MLFLPENSGKKLRAKMYQIGYIIRYMMEKWKNGEKWGEIGETWGKMGKEKWGQTTKMGENGGK